jgi:DNA (cytosine-5)-methyltransferase 1
MKIIELFSGIGAQTQALKNLSIGHTSICCEINKTIHGIYESIHGTTPNLGDISKVDELPACDLLTYSFPCQDLSILGNQKGFDEGSGTRSGLLWEVGRLLKKSKNLPKTLLLENVKQLVSPKHKDNFDKWLDFLSSLGYINTWAILDAQDYGIPQHRERVFVVSSLEKKFQFTVSALSNNLSNFMDSDDDVMKEFGDIHYYSNHKMKERIIKTINNTQSTNSTNRVYGLNSIVHALTTQGSHPGNCGAILFSNQIIDSYPLREKLKGLSECEIGKATLGFDIDSIRLATPREVFRLMGFGDGAYKLAKEYMIQNKININKFYHVSGNSIVVPILEDIFKELFMSKGAS